MTKITNRYIISLIAAGLLVGCGGSSGGGDSDNTGATEQTEQVENGGSTEGSGDDMGGNTQTTNQQTTTSQNSTTAKTFTADVMPVLVAKCKSCHGDNGRFTITTPSATYANISDLKGSMAASGQYLLDKGSNTISHGGGTQIAKTSAEYATIKSWVDSGADFN